jgi:hypothetical protein
MFLNLCTVLVINMVVSPIIHLLRIRFHFEPGILDGYRVKLKIKYFVHYSLHMSKNFYSGIFHHSNKDLPNSTDNYPAWLIYKPVGYWCKKPHDLKW